MDSLIVDLDKVLDDFEAEESTTSKKSGNASLEYANFLAKHDDHSWDEVSRAPVESAPNWKIYNREDNLPYIDYGEPYEPANNFDLSEADFAPSISSKSETVPSKLKNVLTNGHEETLSQEHENYEYHLKNSEKMSQEPVSTDSYSTDSGLVVMNGYHSNNVTDAMSMHSVNNSQMIDLHGCDEVTMSSDSKLLEFDKSGKKLDFDDTYCKLPIQVVDIFTPVSEEPPQIPVTTTYQQKSLTNSSYQSKNFEKERNENINVNLNESVPLHGNHDNRTVERTLSDGTQDNRTVGRALSDGTHDNRTVGRALSDGTHDNRTVGRALSDGTHDNRTVGRALSDGTHDNRTVGRALSDGTHDNRTVEKTISDNSDVKLINEGDLNKDENTSLQRLHNKLDLKHEMLSAKKINEMPSNIQHLLVNNDNKKADEGYDSYDCLSKDPVNDITPVKTENQFMPPNLNILNMSDHDKLSLGCKTVHEETKDQKLDSSDETVVKTLDNNVIEKSSVADVEKVSNVKLNLELEQENIIVGFGDEVRIDENDMDEYLGDIERPETSGNSMNYSISDSSSLYCTSDANSFPPQYSKIDEHSSSLNVEITNTDVANNDLKEQEKHAKEKNVDLEPKTNLSEEHPEVELPSNFNDSVNNQRIPECDQNIDKPMEVNSDSIQVNEMSIQSRQMPSDEIGGARPKDSNRPNSQLVMPKSSVEHSIKQDLNRIYSDDENDIGKSHTKKSISEIDSKEIEIDTSWQCDNDNSYSVCDQLGEDNSDLTDETPVMRRNVQSSNQQDILRPHSWGPSGSESVPIPQQRRPNSLNLPQRGDFNMSGERSQLPYTFPYPPEDTENVSPETVQENITQNEEVQAVGGEPVDEASGASGHTPVPVPTNQEASPQPRVETSLGQNPPMWIPDHEAPVCMGCEAKFTFTKRRHHCRACGKVFCSACCSLKSRLAYMENKEARVCVECHRQITIAELSSQTSGSPNPNNPSEYCSVIPPSQQASARSQPPSVLVPASVLKREGSNRQSSEGKHVMFSDGIRPGGDLTELDGAEASNRLPIRRSGRSQKKVEKGSPDIAHRQVALKLRANEARRHMCLIPETGLPPIIKSTGVKGDFVMEDKQEIDTILPQIKDEEAEPVIFALNANLFVLVKIINLDCCVNRTCWCFTTKGMCNVGQDEMVFVLEVLPNEETIPMDILRHFYMVYEEAGKVRRHRKRRRKNTIGNTLTHMGHTIFNQSFLDSRDHGGILYIRPTFQCLHKLLLPSPPYVFGILLQKWETPWAKVFPLRLLLRLGAEYRYYPCPLISVRNRKPVFFEIGHTIMNLLADFRNFQYMLPQIKGVSIHMEDKKTVINFPRNRYEDLMKVVSNSNEHVMAMGASFSLQADSHLVCIQNDDGNYQTQAINIQNKPRKVTGASFVVFNGALKTSSGLKAKSSIVEDGLMVQITPESMLALKQALKDMSDYVIECGSIMAATPDEVVSILWGDDDKNINIGVKSPIDDMSMDGIESIHIPNATDYVGEKRIIRWTDVFFIQNKDSGSTRWEPVDLSRLAETLSNASCIALTPHLDKLKEASLTKIGLRVNIEIEKVGYEIGANGERLPDMYMNDLDNELIPVIHSAASQNRGGAIILELIFHILD